MRAVYYEQNGAAGDARERREVETPQPGPGEVRIKLKTSGVNPSDVKNRAGTTRRIAFARVIPHSDGAGVIDAVGADVAKSRIGERVWTWNGQWKRPYGTAAEYITLPASQAVKLPDAISFEAGACFGIPALTAWHAVDIAGTTKGMTLLIAGGAGAVAHYAIQFAKARGATVITTISSAEKARLARAAGADHTIDRKTEDVGARVAALTKGGVDAVIELDLTANAALLPSVLRPYGTLVVYGTGPQVQFPGSFCLVNNITVKFMIVYELTAEARGRAVADITRMLEANTLIHNVAATFPLGEIVAAHEAVEQGKVAGNVVMEIG
jgi:NADPH2:quinone reductase